LKSKKIPLRMCIVTREKFPKQELIRIVKSKNNEITVDVTGKVNGHGLYLKKDKNIVLKAKERRILDREFDLKVEDSVYEEIINII